MALTGQYVLPWTYSARDQRLHPTWRAPRSIPAARAVVNFTPVLIEQLEEIAQRVTDHLQNGSALPDPVLALLGPRPCRAFPPGPSGWS